MIYTDSNHTPLTAEALIGRRVRHFNAEQKAFDWEGTIVEHVDGLFNVYRDAIGGQRLCDPAELCVLAVTDEMLDRGADALFASWRRQANPEKVAEQHRTARKHARIVLQAAVER